jgi:lipoprotein signal peptidase
LKHPSSLKIYDEKKFYEKFVALFMVDAVGVQFSHLVRPHEFFFFVALLLLFVLLFYNMQFARCS